MSKKKKLQDTNLAEWLSSSEGIDFNDPHLKDAERELSKVAKEYATLAMERYIETCIINVLSKGIREHGLNGVIRLSKGGGIFIPCI